MLCIRDIKEVKDFREWEKANNNKWQRAKALNIARAVFSVSKDYRVSKVLRDARPNKSTPPPNQSTQFVVRVVHLQRRD